jgi:hypothetical protein
MPYDKRHVVETLRRAGFPKEAEEAEKELPDSVDVDFAQQWAWKRGISKDVFVSRFGGSP